MQEQIKYTYEKSSFVESGSMNAVFFYLFLNAVCYRVLCSWPHPWWMAWHLQKYTVKQQQPSVVKITLIGTVKHIYILKIWFILVIFANKYYVWHSYFDKHEISMYNKILRRVFFPREI